jgi:hypothetical protein
MSKSLLSRTPALKFHIDFAQEMKSLGKKQQFSLIVSFFYTYLLLIGSIFLLLESNTRRQNPTYRMSLQSQMGFGVEPSVFTILICFLVSGTFYLLVLYSLKIKSAVTVLKIFSQMILPSSIIFSIFGLGALFGKVDLRLANYSMPEILKMPWQTTSWTTLANFGLEIVLALLFAIFIAKRAENSQLTSKGMSYIPWLLPVVVNTGFLSAVSGASTSHDKYLIWFTVILNLFFLILYSAFTTNSVVEKALVAFVLGVSLFIYLFSHRPTQVLTWRPGLQQVSIPSGRYLLFSFLAATFLFLFLLFKMNFEYWVSVVTAGFWFGLTSQINSSIVSSLDNFHFGELMGYWLGFSEFNQFPYRSVEFPRGLFVNVIPAAIGDLLSNGFPETYAYWFVALSFLLGSAFFVVARIYLPIPIVFTIIMLLPKPNGYFEIDFAMGLVLLGFIALLDKQRMHERLLIWMPLLGIFLILLAPGQGSIFTALLVVVLTLHFRQNRISLKFLKNWKWVLYFVSIIFSSILLILPSIKWVLRNGRINNSVYGDFWMGRLPIPEVFPISLRFGILLLVPVLLFVLISNYQNLKNTHKQVGIASLIFLIAFSGRWFGRVDQQDMSRIGAGLLVFLIIFLVPLTIRKSTSEGIALVGILTLSLTASVAMAYFPFNQNINFQNDRSSPMSGPQYAEMVQRGETYKRIQEVEKSLFGDGVSRLNLTGGQAIDVYLGKKSSGGIESPYVITNDAQEIDWYQRLQKANVNIVLGPYGSLGAGAFDGSGVGGRAPRILSWIINEFAPVDCSDFSLAIRKSDLINNLSILTEHGCVVPPTRAGILELWNRIDATQSNLGRSFLSWNSSTQIDNLTSSVKTNVAQVSLSDSTQLMRIKVSCVRPQLVIFRIDSTDSYEPITHTFSAEIQSGEFDFKPNIFPIVSLLKGQFSLSIESPECGFVN